MKNIEAILQNDGIADISGWFAGAPIHNPLISERPDKQEGRESFVRYAVITAAQESQSNNDDMDTREDMIAGRTTQDRQELPADNDGESPVTLRKKGH